MKQRTLTLNKGNVTTDVKLGDFDILQFFDAKDWLISNDNNDVRSGDLSIGSIVVDITNGGIGLFRDENGKLGFILIERTAVGETSIYNVMEAPDPSFENQYAEYWRQQTGYYVIPLDEGFNQAPLVVDIQDSQYLSYSAPRIFTYLESLEPGKSYTFSHDDFVDQTYSPSIGDAVEVYGENVEGVYMIITRVNEEDVTCHYYRNVPTPSNNFIMFIDDSQMVPFIEPGYDITEYNGRNIADYEHPNEYNCYPKLDLLGPSTMTFGARHPASDNDVECIYWLPFTHIDNYPVVLTCFIKGQQVQLASGEIKAIEDIQVGDMVTYITDNGEHAVNEVLLPPHKGTCTEYTLYTFSNGTELKIYKSQGIWHEGAQKYRNIEDFKIGDKTKTVDGEIIELVSIEQVTSEEELEHYFLYTYYGNYSVNGILTCTDRAKAMVALLQPENQEFKDRISAADWRLLKKQVQERFDRLRGHFNPKLARLNGQVASEKEKLAERIRSYEHLLNSTDYHVIKYMDGVLAEDEYAPVKQNRITWRQRINELEAQRTDLDNFINGETERYKLRYTHPMFAAVPAHSIITMADGSTAAVEDVRHTDKVATHSGATKMALEPLFYNVWDYHKLTFANGSVLTALVNDLGIYSLDRNGYVDIMSLVIGEKVLLADGLETELVSIEFIEDPTYHSFYQIGTKNGEFIANGFNLKVLNDKVYETVYHPENAYYAAKWDED